MFECVQLGIGVFQKKACNSYTIVISRKFQNVFEHGYCKNDTHNKIEFFFSVSQIRPKLNKGILGTLCIVCDGE